MLDRKDLDLMRVLIEDVSIGFYTDAYIDAYIEEIFNLSKIYQFLFARKVILDELDKSGDFTEDIKNIAKWMEDNYVRT